MQPPHILFKIKNLKTSGCQHLSWGERDRLRRYEPDKAREVFRRECTQTYMTEKNAAQHSMVKYIRDLSTKPAAVNGDCEAIYIVRGWRGEIDCGAG